MSHNTDPQKAARRHPAPMIAIAAALAIAALAAFLFMDAEPEQAGDVSRIEAPASATSGGVEPPSAPESTQTPAAPADN